MELITVTLITITLIALVNYGIKYFNKLDRIESIKRDRAGRFSRVSYTSNKPKIDKPRYIIVHDFNRTYYI